MRLILFITSSIISIVIITRVAARRCDHTAPFLKFFDRSRNLGGGGGGGGGSGGGSGYSEILLLLQLL